jgi:single-strand DNA-binding protein
MPKPYVVAVGRLTKDPEGGKTAAGAECAKLSIACNGRKKDDVTFLNVKAFGQSATFVLQYVKKGDTIMVRGSLEIYKVPNEKTSIPFLNADDVQSVARGSAEGKPANAGGNRPTQPSRPPPPPPPPQPQPDPEQQGSPYEGTEIPF